MSDPKVYSKRRPEEIPSGAIYVGRPTVFGNPFVVGKDGSRHTVCQSYREWLLNQPELLARAKRELRGKDLVCWCAPFECHADILLEIVNASEAVDG